MEQTKLNPDEKPANDEADVKYAYVTFKSSKSLEYVLKAYDRHTTCRRRCVMSFGCCASAKEKEAIRKKHLFKKWPKVTEACTPDNIKWENLSYSAANRTLRVGVNWIAAVILIVLSLAAIVVMKEKTAALKKEYNTDIVCPVVTTTAALKASAYADQQKEASERVGLMHCYCKD